MARHAVRRSARLARVRPIVVAAVLGETSVDDATGPLGRLPMRDRVRLLVDVGRPVAGREHRRLHELASAVGVVDAALRDCASARWWQRLHAIRLLTVVGGGDPIVPSLVEDPHPAVRRAAVRWISDHPSGDAVAVLLRLADAPMLLDDATVVDALHRMASLAIAPIAAYLAEPGEGAAAVLRAAEGFADPRLVGPAIGLASHSDEEVRLRAVRLLAAAGGEEARATLTGRLDDPSPAVRRAAVEGLARTGDWHVAPLLAARVADDDPRIRHAAALALRRFGSPGILLLRSLARGGDPQSERIARHVLDLPDTTDTGRQA